MTVNVPKGFTDLRLHHVGYVTPDILSARKSFGAFVNNIDKLSGTFTDVEQKVNVSFFQLLGGPLIELIEPISDNSPVNRFLSINPSGGFHHIAFEAEDFDPTLKDVKMLGFRRVTSVTTGFEGRSVCFFLPKSGDTTPLIEIVSKTKINSSQND